MENVIETEADKFIDIFDKLHRLRDMKEPDIKLDFRALVEKYGYRLEEHTVTTADGYVL